MGNKSNNNYAKRSKEDFNLFRFLFQAFVVNFVFTPYFKIFYRLEVQGRENIPKDRSFMVAANHLSNLDPPMIASVVNPKRVAFMAKKELFEVPFIKTMIDWLGAFSVNREKLEIATIRTAKAATLTKHWVLSMFPQGNRQEPGAITRLNQGFAYLAKAANVEILPVAVIGSNETNKNHIPFKGKILVKIGKPLPVPTNLEESMDEWAKVISELTGFEYNRENCEGFKNNIANKEAEEKV